MTKLIYTTLETITEDKKTVFIEIFKDGVRVYFSEFVLPKTREVDIMIVNLFLPKHYYATKFILNGNFGKGEIDALWFKFNDLIYQVLC